MLMVAVICMGAAVALGLYAVLSQAEEKAVVRSSLRQLDDYEVESVREKELLAPITERAMAPFMSGLTGLGKRFTPTGYVDEVRVKLVSAGKGDQDAFDRFLAIRVVTVVLAPIAAYFAYKYSPVGGIGQLMLVGLVLARVHHGPRRHPQPPGRGAAVRHPDQAPGRHGPPRDQRRGRPRLRAGARPHRRRGAGSAHRRVRAACSARCGPARAGPTPCAPWTPAPTSPRSGPSCSPSCRPTPSACRSAGCCGPRPTRCASSGGSSPRSGPRRHR